MRNRQRILFIFLLSTTVFGGVARANIYLNESFESQSPFKDQNWAIRDATVTEPNITYILSHQGINIRSYDSYPVETFLSPKVSPIANTGTVTFGRHFRGGASLELQSGQYVRSRGPYVGGQGTLSRLYQFALSASSGTNGLPAGTKVGHFKMDWSIHTTDQVEASLVLNIVVNGRKELEIICENNNALVAKLRGGVGIWKMISVLTVPQRLSFEETNYLTWQCFDPTTGLYKGPQPIYYLIPPNNDPANYRLVSTGVHIYANNTYTTATTVRADDVGAGWGNDGDYTSAHDLNSREQGWEIAAENGGVLYIDEMYWDVGLHNDATLPFVEEQAARMSAFDANPLLPPPPQGPTSAGHWELY